MAIEREYPAIVINFVFLAPAAFVAHGRFAAITT